RGSLLARGARLRLVGGRRRDDAERGGVGARGAIDRRKALALPRLLPVAEGGDRGAEIWDEQRSAERPWRVSLEGLEPFAFIARARGPAEEPGGWVRLPAFEKGRLAGTAHGDARRVGSAIEREAEGRER